LEKLNRSPQEEKTKELFYKSFLRTRGERSVSLISFVDIYNKIDSVEIAGSLCEQSDIFLKERVNYESKAFVIDISELIKKEGSAPDSPKKINLWDPEIQKKLGNIEDEKNLFILAGFEKLSYPELIAMFDLDFEASFSHFQENAGEWKNKEHKARVVFLIAGKAENAYDAMKHFSTGLGTLANFEHKIKSKERFYIKLECRRIPCSQGKNYFEN